MSSSEKVLRRWMYICLMQRSKTLEIMVNLYAHLKTWLTADHRQITRKSIWSQFHDTRKNRYFLVGPMVIYLFLHWKASSNEWGCIHHVKILEFRGLITISLARPMFLLGSIYHTFRSKRWFRRKDGTRKSYRKRSVITGVNIRMDQEPWILQNECRQLRFGQNNGRSLDTLSYRLSVSST